MARSGRSSLQIHTRRYLRSRRYRQPVLTVLAGMLARTRSVLWFAETLVLSARFLQRVRSTTFGEGGSKTRYRTREALWERAVIPALRGSGRPIRGLEFGVATGVATQWWHSNLDSLAGWEGFDTFSGLPEPWTRAGVEVMDSGAFAPAASDDRLPRIEAVCPITWHEGLIGDTIGGLARNRDETLLILVDVDLLDPTRDIMSWVLANGAEGDVIYFDEAFDPFNEGLALQEAADAGLRFETLGYTDSGLAIRVLKMARFDGDSAPSSPR